MAEQGAQGTPLAGEGAQGQQTQPNQPNATPEQIAASILASIEGRNKRTEGGIVRSYAEQYGMSESEVSSILDAERQRRATQLSPEQQKNVDDQLAKANARLVVAEVKVVGATMGLVDADAANLLMDKAKIVVKEDGTVEGVKDALEALKKARPYLFGSTAAKATGMRQRGSEGGSTNEANDALRAIYGKENK